ncbi:probable serine/threonine-protein kinase PknB isoform X4 [Sycon ciliatum]|uniref:probable serine/threonine-protein kinase PknB isoform X4 n=1 Tax=Sycon ciliatum TaxID=27933 RepID=UPI0031F7088C
MELEALPLMRELGLTNQDIVFLGDVRVRQEDELGRGSDAAVYRLTWQGIDIALKVLHPILIEPGVQDRDRKIRSFGQEVFRLSRIHHPNLCQLLGIARVGQNAALALELLTSTLEELSIGEGREDGVMLIGYLCDTSAGIRYLHVRGILHRDLAPKNVMIKNGVAKVCDFGMAKFVRLASPRQQQQQVQAARMAMTRCPGTLAFMPPEALVEQPDYDRPLDIFSFGVTLLAVITGVMPGIDLINAPSVVIVRDAASGRETTQVVAETRRRAAYLRRLPDDHPLKPLAIRCHSNEPSERATAEEVHEEMKRVLQLFTSLSSPHLSNVPPAVVRRLDSISEQLTQQATSITALSARSDTLEEQLTAAITNNQTTTQQQLTSTQQQLSATQQQLTATQQQLTAAITNNQTTTQQQLTVITNHQTATQQQLTDTQQQLTDTREQVSTIQDEQSSATQRLTEHLDAIAGNQTMTQQQLTATQSTIHNDQTTTNRRVQTLADQLRDTNEQTSRQMTTLTDQISAVSGQLSTMSASTHQIRPTTAPESLSCSASATASATTAVVPVSSPIAAQDSHSSSASATALALAPASPTATRLQVRPTTAPESLSSSASPMSSATTATVRPTTAPESLSSSASATTTVRVPVSSPIAAQDSRASSASATAPAPASPTATRLQVRPTTAPESLSSSASAMSSATTATVPVSSPIAAQDNRASSASASAPAAASATATRAEASAAASTAVSSVGRGYHVLPAMPTPTQIANIKKRRKWNKVVGGPGKSFFEFWNTSRPEVPPHGKHARLATYRDKLVAVWYDGVNVTKMMETSDLQTWHSIDLPSEYSKLTGPSLASHGRMLYMHCNTYTKSTNRWVHSILQYCDTPDNGDDGRSGGGGGGDGGGGGQWTKLTDVPHCNHAWCTLHVGADAISLYGGYDGERNHNHVSTYSLASKQWSSSSSSNASLVLPSLPLPCSLASLVPFPDSLYLVGGVTGCFPKHHDGRWVSTSPPDGVELKFSAACALSDQCMVICPHTPSTKCVVHDISSGQVYPLPAMPEFSGYNPSLTLFSSTLVLSVGGDDTPTALYTLDMSV